LDKENFRKEIQALCKGKEFILNPDEKHTNHLIEGIFKLEKEKGLKYCPCRLPEKNKKYDVSLLCPCNFFIQKTWENEGRCWCGLFMKK
jgi:ferredoxin-thioredoxin reductase catalytic chain